MNFHYRRLIPNRFQKKQGVDKYQFRVWDPWHRPFQFVQYEKGDIYRTQVCASCTIRQSGKVTPVLIGKSDCPSEYEAVINMGKLLFEKNREQKYITLHKAYECLEKQRDITLSAVRHGLSHAASVLNRPRTRNALLSVFGTTNIDLSNHRHVRVFYEHFGKLLIETDALLFNQIVSILPKTYSLPPGAKLVHDWQMRELQRRG